MNNKNKIGIFDSGLGGLSILKELLFILPNEDYLFYEDSINNPYGEKSDDELFSITSNIVEYLLENDHFKGYVDCVEHLDDKHVKIYDFKYSNNIENYKKSDQLHLYKKYYEELNPTVKVVELAYIMIPKIQIRQKKTENTVNFYHRLDEELEKAEVKKIIVEYDENKTNEFLLDCEVIKNTTDFIKRESSFCRFCNFYDYCQKGLSCDIISKN